MEKLDDSTNIAVGACGSEEYIVNDVVPEEIYPRGMKLYLTTIALALTIFCVALDNTIIATAIPRITDDFSSINDVGWYASSYLLTSCAFQLFYGKVYTICPLKWGYLVALGFFEVGSAICGAAPNSTSFIIGRAIAGIGCAGLFSGALLIIADTVPLRMRPTYTGLLGSMYGIASISGPLLGGVFTDHVSWRWCFYINLPIGAVTAIFILLFYTAREKDLRSIGWKKKSWLLDPVGTVLFLATVICLLLALQMGGSEYSWKNFRIILLLVLSGVCLIVFLGVQLCIGENATIPRPVVRNRTVAACAWFSFCLGGSFFTLIYFVPIWFQAVQGVDATTSAIRTIPMLLSLIVMCIISGGTTTLLGHYTPFIWISAVLTSVGAGLISTWKGDTPAAAWIGHQVIFGLGAGAGFQQPLMAVQNVLPVDQIAIGTALVMFSQTLGGAIFVSVAQNLFTNRLLANLQSLVPGISRSMVLLSGATDLRKLVPPSLEGSVKYACNDAIIHACIISVVMACLSALGAIGVEWKSMRRSVC